MARWGKHSRSSPPETPAEVAKRIALLQTADFTPWVEQSLFIIGRSLHDYECHLELAHIDDAITAANTIVALLNEFRHRVE